MGIMKQLINELKENDQDFEFYPTMDKIIDDLYLDVKKQRHCSKILDIGAGNGKVLNGLSERGLRFQKFAIEKSKILIDSMQSDTIIIGTDFLQQSLIDKKMDLIFCNPPYRQFIDWTIKIIKEADTRLLYLVIPERWKDSKEINDVIAKRSISHKVINTYDFTDAEDRKARAKVNLIRFDLTYRSVDAFDLWFKENFKFSKKVNDERFTKKSKEEIKELISGKSNVKELVLMYMDDLDVLMKTYQTVDQLPCQLLNDIGVDISKIMESLKIKIEGLKNTYWQILFSELDVVVNRLTVRSREIILSSLFANTCIDFTEQNIYAVVAWLLKNANLYYDKQLVDHYMRLTAYDNIKPYKSNKKFLDDSWKHIKRIGDRATHFKLDYRIIYEAYSIFDTNYQVGYTGKLKENAHDFLSDFFTIANNLGFDLDLKSIVNQKWKPREKQEFFYTDYAGKNQLFCDIKGYSNGNFHLRFCPEFMKRFNMEAGRLLGWLKSPEDVVNEFDDITIQEATAYFNCNKQLIISNIPLLTCQDFYK